MEKERNVLTRGAQERVRRGARMGPRRHTAHWRRKYKTDVGLETKGVLEQHWREADKTVPLALYDGPYCQLKSTAVSVVL